jgi:IS30 family transposase
MTTSTSYTHLSTHERSIIQIRIKDRHSLRDIASEIGRSPSTVSREVRRNCTSRGYLSYDADLRAAPRHHRRRAWLDKHEDVARALVDVLQDKRSPAQALSILLERGVPYLPSVESIYQWIYSSSVPTAWDARSCLRRGRHYRKPRTGLASGVGKIRDTTHISAR